MFFANGGASSIFFVFMITRLLYGKREESLGLVQRVLKM